MDASDLRDKRVGPSRRALGFGAKALGSLVMIVAAAGFPTAAPASPKNNFKAKVAVEWMDLFRQIVQTSRLSPPVASRVYAYAGVTLYESIVAGCPGRLSLAGQLNEMPEMPQPEKGVLLKCEWAAVESTAVGDGRLMRG
jgi:hypothetical protein